MPAIDDLLARAAAPRSHTPLTGPPTLGLAIVACMDARLQVETLLHLAPNEAHVIRNAGGIVTHDVLRSLLLSQRLLGTREVMVIQHTDCGMTKFDDDHLQAELQAQVGRAFPGPLGAFSDLEASVRAAVDAVRRCEFLPARETVRGFVYDVAAGALSEVVPAR